MSFDLGMLLGLGFFARGRRQLRRMAAGEHESEAEGRQKDAGIHGNSIASGRRGILRAMVPLQQPARSRRVRSLARAVAVAVLLLAVGGLRAEQTPITAVVEAALPQEPAPQPAVVRGSVVDADGSLVPGATVRLSPSGGRAALEATCDAEGTFRFDAVPAGPFVLTVSAKGFAPVEVAGKAVAGQPLQMSAVKLTVATAEFEVNALSTHEIAEMELQHAEHQRLLGVVPNFGISYDWNAPPMNTGQKYRLATRFVFDPFELGIAAVQAGAEQAGNAFPAYGQGVAGFAKRYGAAFADQAIGNELGGAVFPSLFHQDPRYFWKGTGSAGSRAWYAVKMSVISRGDNGHDQFNVSGIAGFLASGAVANLYYPAENRGSVSLTFENAGIGLGASAIANLIQEFLLKHVTPNSKKLPANTTGVAGGTLAVNAKGRRAAWLPVPHKHR